MKMLEAEMAFRRGELLLRKNDFLGAIRELEQSVAMNPQEGEHLAFLTWARVCAGQTSYADARNLLNQAIKLSPMCARAYYYLGVCLKEEKDVDRAYGMFKKAHELDGRLIDAEREMRLINMRRGKEKSSGGFFDRFRKPHK
jgi:tetratricopeptide (TPR) repeat protein